MSFRFKQFAIEDNKCAMKVGTDGVLLGAWCPITNYQLPITNTPFRVLDVGTGSGLIARMLMQRCPQAQVEAIDIDPAAVEQARENGVNAFQARLQDWKNDQSPMTNDQSPMTNDQYDLVVSNPPYFQDSLKNPDKSRQTARHTDTLSYEDLIRHSARLLTMHGQLALILPAEAEMQIRGIAAEHMLTLTRITRVYTKESKPARRVLMAFEMSRPRDLEITTDTLVLENETGGRSAAYSELCKEFYL